MACNVFGKMAAICAIALGAPTFASAAVHSYYYEATITEVILHSIFDEYYFDIASNYRLPTGYNYYGSVIGSQISGTITFDSSDPLTSPNCTSANVYLGCGFGDSWGGSDNYYELSEERLAFTELYGDFMTTFDFKHGYAMYSDYFWSDSIFLPEFGNVRFEGDTTSYTFTRLVDLTIPGCEASSGVPRKCDVLAPVPLTSSIGFLGFALFGACSAAQISRRRTR